MVQSRSSMGRRSGRAQGRSGGTAFEGERISVDDVRGWLAGRLPDDWFEAAPEVTVDRDEILIIGRVPAPDLPGNADEPAVAAAEIGRISRFREDTRDLRIAIAREAEHRFGRPISWGARVGIDERGVHQPFGAGDDPFAAIRAHRARHPGRRRRGPQPVGRAGMVRETGLGQHGRVAAEAPLGHGSGGVGPRRRARGRLTLAVVPGAVIRRRPRPTKPATTAARACAPPRSGPSAR